MCNFFFLYHSYFTEAYGSECLATAVKLLKKICKGTKPSFNQNYANIPVACMNLVASITDFVHSKKQQVCEVKRGGALTITDRTN